MSLRASLHQVLIVIAIIVQAWGNKEAKKLNEGRYNNKNNKAVYCNPPILFPAILVTIAISCFFEE